MGGVASAGGSPADTILTFDDLGPAPQNDLNDGAGDLYVVKIDCTDNTGEDVYVCFYDHATPTVGTTDPELCLKGIAGTVKHYIFHDRLYFGTAVSVACVQEKGGGGATAPSGTVAVTIGLS